MLLIGFNKGQSEFSLTIIHFVLVIYGVGFPYEDPCPLEAISAGTVYILPKVRTKPASIFSIHAYHLQAKQIFNKTRKYSSSDYVP